MNAPVIFDGRNLYEPHEKEACTREFDSCSCNVIGKDRLRRSYSVANAPAADRLIELHIAQLPEGAMRRYWFGEVKTNDLLLFKYIALYTIRKNSMKSMMFVKSYVVDF